MKYLLIFSLVFMFFTLFSFNNKKDFSSKVISINDSIKIESIDSIYAKEYIFYILNARNKKNEPIKIMEYVPYSQKCTNSNKIEINKIYKLNLITWFRTTYFNELDCFTFDNVKFCRDSIYKDIYGSKNLKGLCLIKEEDE